MPNTATYKDWLFVKLPEDAHSYHVIVNELVYRHESKIVPSLQLIGEEKLPPGSWQIIGKGDRIGWDEIVSYNHNVYGTWYRDYCNDKSNKKPQSVFPFDNPTESGHSLLRSLKMEPGTTLVLKKNEPIIQDSELHHPQYYPKSDKQR